MFILVWFISVEFTKDLTTALVLGAVTFIWTVAISKILMRPAVW